jgi:hypothetical protein
VSKPPIPIRQVLDYLTVEDVEGLVPGSVKYVGQVIVGRRTMHYWSYPAGGDSGGHVWMATLLGSPRGCHR